MKTLPDYLCRNLKAIFVGTNPGITSAEVGHYHAHKKTNCFWKALYESGLTKETISPEKDATILSYGYGLTDVVKKPTKGDRDLKEGFPEGNSKV
jgi:TDG/mug DNA glycosylase family protein